MNTTSRTFLTLAAAALLLATALGAYGAHALAATLPPARMSAYGTAVDYQFYHGLGLLAVALLTERYPQRRAFRVAGFLLVVGIVLFCGALYATSFGASAAVGLAAPVGGTMLMLAWLTLAIGACLARQGSAANPLA
ncbi:MAG TPA: DUF423 domain-containing protein [Gammaproteobacteria bacterium]|nr:DUF423 domain-containing protein [Gammaproteobacteria bacterium]